MPTEFQKEVKEAFDEWDWWSETTMPQSMETLSKQLSDGLANFQTEVDTKLETIIKEAVRTTFIAFFERPFWVIHYTDDDIMIRHETISEGFDEIHSFPSVSLKKILEGDDFESDLDEDYATLIQRLHQIIQHFEALAKESKNANRNPLD